jgi:hypothetical protein
MPTAFKELMAVQRCAFKHSNGHARPTTNNRPRPDHSLPTCSYGSNKKDGNPTFQVDFSKEKKKNKRVRPDEMPANKKPVDKSPNDQKLNNKKPHATNASK